MDNLPTEVYLCECHCADHVMVVTTDPTPSDDGEDFERVFFEMQLADHPSFWKRVFVAIRYMFRVTPSWNNRPYWGGPSLKKVDVERLIGQLQNVLPAYKNDRLDIP